MMQKVIGRKRIPKFKSARCDSAYACPLHERCQSFLHAVNSVILIGGCIEINLISTC